MRSVLQPRNALARRACLTRSSTRFGTEVTGEIRHVLEDCLAYRSTPLISLPVAANTLGLGRLWAKDERSRLGFSSFKALGGTYAVLSIASELASTRHGRSVSIRDLLAERMSLAPSTTFTAATAGNHGRAVAAGASLVGGRCVVFVPEGVPEDQLANIASHGAEIVRVAGAYEHAVDSCRRRAEGSGWIVVADTSWEGYTEVPTRIMQGYTVLVAEAMEQAPVAPTHVVVQSGVGGLAGAIAGYFASTRPEDMPVFVVVEPESAACLLASAQAGKMLTIPFARSSNMGRLDCYRPSPVAWEILSGLADAFVAISDEDAVEAMIHLAQMQVRTSPSGAAGMAGLSQIMRCQHPRAALQLGVDSSVLIIITEDATALDHSILGARESSAE
jgi:diaminopropionate ammonia-lyase